MSWLARQLLGVTEAIFLFAHGWLPYGWGNWAPPAKHPRRGYAYTKAHAVNSQKCFLRSW